MAVQLTLDRCGVVLLDRSRGGTALGSQPQRGPLSATDYGSDPSGVTMDGRSRTNGQPALRIAHWNAEGVRNKKTELQHFLKKNAIDVCCIQETHLSPPHRFFMRGFEVFRQDRETRTKGGLITLVRNTIPAVETQRSDQADPDTEFLGVKLVLTGSPVTVFNIYSPPDKPIHLHNIRVDAESWLITGDFNSHSPSWGYRHLDNKGEEVENWITDNRLVLINRPDDPDTYYSRSWRTTSTPDLAIATDNIHGIAEREVSSQLGGSDHKPVIITIKRQLQTASAKRPPSWNFKKADWEAYRADVDERTAGLTLSDTDINHNVSIFNKAILPAAKSTIPRGRRQDYKPYWTPELDTLHTALSEARDAMEQSPTAENVVAHSKAKAEYTRERLQATRRSWHEKTASLNMEKDMQGLWKLTKTLNDDNPARGKTVLEVNNQLSTEKRAANDFADLYRKESTTNITAARKQQVREETRNSLLSTPDGTNLHPMTAPFSMKELNNALRRVKTKRAPGPDGITGEMLKRLGPTSKKVLLCIFNQSWSMGIVPTMWKEAHIVPILKKGKDKKNPRSYRPISLLSCVGKLMERLVNLRLIIHLETKGLLSPTQTGYRKHRSTEDQLAYLAQCAENAFQEKRKLLAVFFDLSRAFDKVWKEGLLLKLLQTGVRRNMWSWMHHFLYGRTARVKVDGHLSKKVILREGVPQGGVLSPTLFLVYINDIIDSLTRNVSNTLHADDLAIWTTSEHTSSATVRMQEAVNKIDRWTQDWGLTINESKTQATLFSLSTSKERVTLRLKDQVIPQTDTPTFLGVKLDSRLTWKPQIEEMERRSLKKMSLMRKLAGTSWGADSRILTRVYTGAVRPTMEYASTTWGTAAKTNKQKLDKVQNIGLRIVLGALKTTPVHEMEKTADVEPLERRRNLRIVQQGEKLRRLPSHPLHSLLNQPTKNRLKRQSLNHHYKALRREDSDITGAPCQPLSLGGWRPDDEADVTISLSVPGITSRDQLAPDLKSLTLQMIEEKFPPDTWTHVYTDGSAAEAVRDGGSGVLVRFSDGATKSVSVPGGKLCTNYQAEILAIKTAADFLTELGKDMGNVVIFSDSMSTLQALQSPDPDQHIKQLHSSLANLTAQTPVTLQWVPAHVGLSGNEEADRLAKAGSQLQQPDIPVTYQELKTLLHSRYKAKWNSHNNGYQARQDPIRNLERKHQTTIFRLRTGHCCLKGHLKRIGVGDTSTCQCGQAEETPDHILQSCPRYAAERQDVWPEAASVNTKLWGTAADLKRTASFVATAGIKI